MCEGHLWEYMCLYSKSLGKPWVSVMGQAGVVGSRTKPIIVPDSFLCSVQPSLQEEEMQVQN